MNLFTRFIKVLYIVAGAGFALTAGSAGATESVDNIKDMVSQGKVKLDFRYRFENVDQDLDGDGIEEEAEASTLRSRLSFTSAAYRGFSVMAEVDDLSYIGDDDFNSTSNGNTSFPVVADPKGTDLNQAWVKYQDGAASATYGRQRILHGSQRFVGGVGWRQNEQTYDALRVQWQGPQGLSFDYAYVDTVNRIFGPNDGPVQPADLEGDNHLARLGWKICDDHSLTAFAYSIDIDEDINYAPGKSVENSSNTYGLDYAGKFGPLSAKASYASQEDAGDSTRNYDADYYLVELGATLSGVKGTLGHEVLEGDDEGSFRTPYATLHKFQGWADKFLVTPVDGIEDTYAGLSGKAGPFKLAVVYHEFEANDSNADFGTEWDAVATWPVTEIISLQVKYANFETDDEERYQDTEKFWFTAQVKL